MTAAAREISKVLVVSDTHGDPHDHLKTIVEREAPFDLLIHCGDSGGDLLPYKGSALFPVLSVRGNCDFGGDPEKAMTTIGYAKILVVHGDRFMVRTTTSLLEAYAKKAHADIVLFGHTHVPEIFRKDGILFLNPGSAARSRYRGINTYAVLTINSGLRQCSAIIRNAITGAKTEPAH